MTRIEQTSPISMSKAAKYERLAFTFCKMGTVGLLAWLMTPPIFTLVVGIIAVLLYGWPFTLGITRSRCFLRKPLLIMSFSALVIVLHPACLFVLRPQR